MRRLSFLSKTTDLPSNKHEQILLTSNFKTEKCGNPMSDFCSIYKLCNLIKVSVSCKNRSKLTCINLMLTNSPRRFYKPS